MRFDCCSYCDHGHRPRNHIRRDGWDYPHGDEGDIAEPVTDRLAVLPDGVFLRLTPPDQPTVDEILHPGTLIETSYGSRIRKVFKIRRREYYCGIPAYTIAIGDPETPTREDGCPKHYKGANIKELVYQDGEIRKLFLNNEDTVEVVGYEEIEAEYQATLSAGWSA